MSGKRKTKIIGIAACLLCIAVVTVFGCIRQGIFFRTEDKILLAAGNTFRDSVWLEALTETGLLDAKEATAAFQWKNGIVQTKAELEVGEEETGISFQMGVLGISVDFEGILTENNLKMHIPLIENKIFSYTWDDGVESAVFEDLLGHRLTENIDLFLGAAAGLKWRSAFGESSLEEWRKRLRNCKFEKTKAQVFTIDQKEVSCSGYQGNLSGLAQSSVTDHMDGTIFVYVYKSKLAAIRWETEECSYEIQFAGGKTRDQEMVCAKEGAWKIDLRAVSNSNPLEWKLIYSDERNTRIAMKGAMTAEGMQAEILSASYHGQDSKIGGEISLTPGAEFPQFEGEVVDVKELTAEEMEKWKNFINQIEFIQNQMH